MIVLEYAFGFMELSCFAPAFIAGEKLKMNRFEVGYKCRCISAFTVRICTTELSMWRGWWRRRM